jgi:hypothetical protein
VIEIREVLRRFCLGSACTRSLAAPGVPVSDEPRSVSTRPHMGHGEATRGTRVDHGAMRPVVRYAQLGLQHSRGCYFEELKVASCPESTR